MKKTILLLFAAILNAVLGALCGYVSAVVFMNAVNDGYGAALWAAIAIVFVMCVIIVVINALFHKISRLPAKHYIPLAAVLFLAGLVAACIYLFGGLAG